MNPTMLALLVLLMPLSWVYLAVRSIAYQRARKRLLEDVRRTSSDRARAEIEEERENLNGSLVLDSIFAIGITGLGIWSATRLPWLTDMHTKGEVSMADIWSWALRILVGASIFLVLYALCSAIFPKILPEEGTRQNDYLSKAISALLAFVAANLLVASNDNYESIKASLQDTLGKSFTTVIAILGIGLTVYLGYAKMKVMLKPTRNQNRTPKEGA